MRAYKFIYTRESMADSLTHQWTRTELLGKDLDSARIRLYSDELQVTDSTPGTFLSHAMDDAGVSVANSLYFYAALLQHHVPAQLFLYAKGGHAYSVHNRMAAVQRTDECFDWIKQERLKRLGVIC